MRDHVIVIPEDKRIIVDGEVLHFSFPAPMDMHALQWHDGSGHIERKGREPGRSLSADDYGTDVLPFVRLWEKEMESHMKTVREGALHLLKERRKRVEYGGFVFNGQRWDSEEKDEMRLNSAITLMNTLDLKGFAGWEISANTTIILTLDVASLAAAAMMRHYNDCFVVEREKKDAIARLALPGEVNDWLTHELGAGWPGQGETA